MTRNYGVTSRPASGDEPPTDSHYSAGARADSNPYVQSEYDDRDFAALIFGLLGLTLPFAMAGVGLTVYFAFFE